MQSILVAPTGVVEPSSYKSYIVPQVQNGNPMSVNYFAIQQSDKGDIDLFRVATAAEKIRYADQLDQLYYFIPQFTPCRQAISQHGVTCVLLLTFASYDQADAWIAGARKSYYDLAQYHYLLQTRVI